MTNTSRRRSVWVELPPGAEATYYKVRCNLCGFETVKLGGRNVALCQTGHHGGHHFGHPRDFSVIPMKRLEQSPPTVPNR